ncbi:AfsR/SARP family transcriptional regulator [Sphaerisporangium dianthi]|uniref:Tetratricopeptide repeat protein n=1 Tax=Sphaerisporangium dianthi TaxID=1436120 RepID=A0ABV9C8C4_9ACTN
MRRTLRRSCVLQADPLLARDAFTASRSCPGSIGAEVILIRTDGRCPRKGTRMEFRILGPVELWSQERRHDVGWAKERLVIAVLLLAPGRPVPIRSLIAKLWDGDPPAQAAALLQSSVSRLRKRLQEIAGTAEDESAGPRLRRVSGSYILETDVENIDLHRFRKLRADARGSAGAGDIDNALRLYREAEDQWRGEPLAGLPGAWADITRKNLEEEMLGGTMERITLELGQGDHTRLVAELSELVTRYPLDEKLIELLMRTLYANGRQADALAAYRQARERFTEQLGTEPDPTLRDLHQRILRRDPGLVAGTRPRHTSGPAPPNDLPRDLPTFTGRTDELAPLTSDRVLDGAAVPVLAIDGMPGVGKTAFAVHLAHLVADRYHHGRLYLDLHGHSPLHEPLDPATALDRLLRHLGVPGDIPEGLDARAARWRKELAGHKVLIVLDDATGTQQIRHLLPGEPGCLVIVTSRRRLTGLEGVESLSLDVLPPRDAAELLHRAAGRHRPLEPDGVAAVTRLCGYLPLAIQIVGSKLRHRPAWSAADLADRLGRGNQRLAEIRAENREVIAAFRLSYEGLTGFQQRAFTRLGLYPGTELTAHCVAALLGRPLAIAERFLDDLLDHHLIAEPRRGRYRLHDLIRDYATSLADQESESERTEAVHRVLDYHLFLADRADRLAYRHRARASVEVTGPPAASPDMATTDQALSWLRTELDNLLRLTAYSADHGWTRHTAMFAHVLSRHLSFWGHWADAVRVHTDAIEAWRRLDDPRGLARALTDLSEVLRQSGRLDECLDITAQALSIRQAQGDRHGVAELLDQSGLAHWQRSEFDAALGHFQRALDIRRAMGDHYGQAISLNHIAGIADAKGDYQAASDRLREVLALHEEDGDLHGRQVVLNNIGELEARRGQYSSALEYYERAAALAPETGPREEAGLLHNTANVLQHLGRHGEALERYRKALRLYREIGDRRGEAHTLNSIGSCYAGTGNDEQALVHHQRALSISADVVERQQQARALTGIGDAHQHARRHHAALEFYEQALRVARAIGDVHQEAQALRQMGSTLDLIGDPVQARRLWRQALKLYEDLGVPEALELRTRLHNPPRSPDV